VRGTLHLPSVIKLTCESCGEVFRTSLRSLDGRLAVICPFCTSKVVIYDSVTPEVRRMLYRAAREKLEETIMSGLDFRWGHSGD